MSGVTDYSGSCLCGAIRYQITEFEPLIGHCHCHMCQKFHGSAFSTFAEVKLGNLQWISGVDHLASYLADNGTVRQFCKTCGSSLTFCSSFNVQANTIEIAAASLDKGAQNLHVDAHIYTRYKVPWLTLNDDLPKFQEYRDND